jgi:Rrf2 family transcriptional regulator, iron-sulfur cluster assembly transcription factor
MLWSNACEYAIRATTYLAERPDAVVQLKDIAAAERLPAPFVAKILLSLVKAGVLRSVKGPGGGYGLARPASAITFLEVKAATDGTQDLDACLAGLGTCTSAVPCALHESFAPIRRSIREYLERTTIADASAALARKRVGLARAARRGRRRQA